MTQTNNRLEQLISQMKNDPDIHKIWPNIIDLSNEWHDFLEFPKKYIGRLLSLIKNEGEGTSNEIRIFDAFRVIQQPSTYTYMVLLLVAQRLNVSLNGQKYVITPFVDVIHEMQAFGGEYDLSSGVIYELIAISEKLSQPEKEFEILLIQNIIRLQANENNMRLMNQQGRKEDVPDVRQDKLHLAREQTQYQRQRARDVQEQLESLGVDLSSAKKRQEQEKHLLRKQKEQQARMVQERKEQQARMVQKRKEQEELLAIRKRVRARLEKEREEQEARLNAEKALRQLCHDDFLAVDRAFTEQSILNSANLTIIRTTFLREWFTQHLPDSATQPDDNQLNAIGSVHGNVQVIARAGSGKTSTLVYRVFFLIKHCRVNANEIMMLAFNRKAANEMRERLLRLLYPKVIPEYEQYKHECRAKMRRDQIDEVAISLDALTHLRTGKEIPLPFIMTFHGLVHNVVNPSETLIYDTRDPEGAIQSKSLQSLIDTHIRAQDMQGRAIRQLMLHYFRSEWIDIEDNQYGLSQAEFLEYRRSIVNLSLQGHPVKSYGEKKIADFLFAHNVTYSYESDIVIGKVRYRPDFTIWKDKQRIIIEYAGLQGNADYDALLEQKRKAYDSQKNLVVIELTPDDIKDIHAFERRMLAILKQYDIPFRQLDDDEIWELIKDRAVGGFSRLMNGFIQKCRQLLINPVDLDKRIRTHRPLTKGNLEVEFAKLARTFYQEYIDYCVDNNVIDFSTLMQRATQLIRDGKSDFSKRHSHGNITQIRFLSIDEFQDFSVLFYELLSAMRGMNPTMQLFCVGDDWQAINRFAGADTRFFTDFERYIGPRTVCHITSNYRSARRIVALGNAVMQGRGVSAKAAQSQSGLIVMIYIDDFISNDKESEYFGRYGYDFAALSRLLYVHAYYKNNVTVLSRTSAPLEDVFPKIRKLFKNTDEVKLLHSTTHGYKGLEQESIILWDVTDRQYPMLHAHWIFGRILGDTLEQIIEDERRLFYVGVTRASKTLYIVTRRQSMSPFLASAISGRRVKEVSFNTLVPVDTLQSGTITIRLTGDTFMVKDAIKQSNYKWNQSHKTWEKLVLVDDFSLESLAHESWFAQASNIIVTCVDETENVLNTYIVNAGSMTEG